jgi:hypothetical protein
MGKQKKTGLIRFANGAAFLQIPSQASLQMSFQKPHYPGKPGVHRFFLDANSWQFLILRKARKARALAERVDAEFSQFRASTLEKGFEKAAPAWLAQALPFVL